jgi:hypothetical protein
MELEERTQKYFNFIEKLRIIIPFKQTHSTGHEERVSTFQTSKIVPRLVGENSQK